jgi:hypothetical protein
VSEEEVPAVALLTCALGDDTRFLAGVEALGDAGLVLEAFGRRLRRPAVLAVRGRRPVDTLPETQQPQVS